MKLDSALARKTAIPSKSTSSPQRSAGVRASTRSCSPSISERDLRVMWVLIQPGRMALTWMLSAAQPAAALAHPREQTIYRGLVGDVDGDGDCIGAQRLELRDGRLFRVARRHDDARTGSGEAARHAEADAAIATRDHRHFALQVEHVWSGSATAAS